MAAVELPELLDKAVEEVLLHFPPDDPASLLRAALVRKSWSRIVSNPGFRRRYAERHRAAPALGFVCNLATVHGGAAVAHFVATSPSSFRPPRAAVHPQMRALDARHGRVLLLHDPPLKQVTSSVSAIRLVVWDPIADEHRELPAPPMAMHPSCWNAAVVCAAAGCDHLDCPRHGPFKVVVVGVRPDRTHMYSCVYSSEPGGAWSRKQTAPSTLGPHCCFKLKPSALVVNALHFVFRSQMRTSRILRYDLATKEMSAIELPCSAYYLPRGCLVPTGDGRLGFVEVGLDDKLYLWSSRVDGLSRIAEWRQSSRAINVKALLPAKTKIYGGLRGEVGFAGGIGIILVMTAVENFLIDLKSKQARKLAEDVCFDDVFPFTRFCIPEKSLVRSEI
ncbi:unnamed protein product [Urochloa decumbens]|uniref:F-box domain-containing protein n=1 Tax=Urochloa decumbens TaxID=240449 RepID=A0ABC9D9X4_9POAL